MLSFSSFLFMLLGLSGQAVSQLYTNSTTPEDGTVKIQWLEQKPAYNPGTTFGVPWPRGINQANDTSFAISSGNGSPVPSESWITGYWSDSSVKWTAHAIAAGVPEDGYTVNALSRNSSSRIAGGFNLTVKNGPDVVEINTGEITATFAKTGNTLFHEIKTSNGQVVGQNGKLILRSQSSVFDDEDKQGQPATNYFKFDSKIDNVTVSKDNTARALVTVRGDHRQVNAGNLSAPAHRLDWSGQAAAWLIQWERRGPRWEEAKSKLLETMKGIANLKNGFVTSEALYNLYNGTISPSSQDPNNKGVVGVSHLTAVFGLVEVIAELTTHFGDAFPSDFEQAWLDYCYYFSALRAEQQARYGKAFGKLNLYQGHSRLTAYAANKLNNATLAARAWNEFYNTDGFKADAPWKTERVEGSKVLFPIDEAAWVNTNDVGQYGLAAIENLALIGEYLP
jgi:hypothetical protein